MHRPVMRNVAVFNDRYQAIAILGIWLVSDSGNQGIAHPVEVAEGAVGVFWPRWREVTKAHPGGLETD